MIDIHCHLLPNIDDGPSSWEESIELAQMLSEEGVKIAITTPHWIKGSGWEPNSENVKDMVDELNLKIKEESISLTVLPGMEVGITENILELVNQGRILTLNGGSYLLLETPFISIPLGIEEVIFRLKESGIVPIFAHPERCREIQSNPKRLKDISENGALIQITTSSLLGYFGHEAMECANFLANENLVNIIASDAHSATNRPPIIKRGLTKLTEIVGEERVNNIKEKAYDIINS
ncbi:hypothetical protein MYX76_01710 [Desulfobacterota bacterium AH_259_B03_O07]|nr:hypothetical protein [Desulfobacterota bacterium AH_259_B03_O07]